MSAVHTVQLWCLAAATGIGPSFDLGPRRPLEPSARGTTRPTTSITDRGQATTEYALVLLGASAIALLVITWATAGGGAGRIGRLFDRVIDAVIGKL
jgi:hypothetical protein